jgi:hypothetical protein
MKGLCCAVSCSNSPLIAGSTANLEDRLGRSGGRLIAALPDATAHLRVSQADLMVSDVTESSYRDIAFSSCLSPPHSYLIDLDFNSRTAAGSSCQRHGVSRFRQVKHTLLGGL